MDVKQEHLHIPDAPSNATDGNSRVGLIGIAYAARTRLFELYVLIVSLMVGFVILVYLRWTLNPKQIRKVLKFWSTSFVSGASVILGISYRIEGLENIPNQPVIFAGNHQSYWESIAMTALVPDLNVVTKRSAMAIPVFGWGLFHAPMTPIDRHAPGQNIRRMVREGRTCIAEGRSMLIYPEGERVPPGKHRRFARGLELIYRECGAPIVPFVTDAGVHWPTGFATKRPGITTLRFLPPIAAGRDPRSFAIEIERLLNEEKDELLVQGRLLN